MYCKVAVDLQKFTEHSTINNSTSLKWPSSLADVTATPNPAATRHGRALAT